MRRALRNKLVHAYLDMDEAEVYALASDPRDVEEFREAVGKLFAKPPSS